MRLRERQLAFAAHLRDPQRHPAPAGIEDRRMQVYRDLFFNNLSSLLAGTFPVLHRILGRERWRALVRDFFAHHRCRTPLFLEVPREFLTWLTETRAQASGDPPFMLELAHYEWIELAQSIDPEEIDCAGIDRHGDLITGIPVLSPLAIPLVYRFPVHRLSPDYQPEEPPAQPSFYVVCRDLADRVGFIEINAVTARLLELIEESPEHTGHAHVQTLAVELRRDDVEQLRIHASAALGDLRSRDVILGTRIRTEK